MPSAALHFGPFTLLPGEQRLLRDGGDVPLGPRAFEMLCLLVRRPGQLVSKDELLETVWRGLVVEEANLHVQVSQLRKVVGPEAVVTVPGRGYRFALPVAPAAAATAGAQTASPEAPPQPGAERARDVQEAREVNEARETRGASAEAARPPPPLRRLSVIVLPFIESGATPEQEYFADAITDDVTTQLSKIRGSYVIGSPTALAHKRERFDIATLARELGVRYVLQGRLERFDAGVEANVRLSDATTGAVVWSDTIEVPRSGVLHLRRELVARLANALGLELIAAEAGRTRAEPAGHAEADDLVMQAMTVAIGSAWSAERIETALGLNQQALRLAPDHAWALRGRARCLAGLVGTRPGPDDELLIAQADADITRSLELDSLAAASHDVLARVRQLQFRLDAALAAGEQALQLNPNDPLALGHKGKLMIFSGLPEQALEFTHRALCLSPRDPMRSGWLLQLGWAHLLLGQYEQAAVWLEKSLAAMPFWPAALFRAAALGHLGRAAESQAALARVAELVPPKREGKRRLWFYRDSNHETYLALHREHVSVGLLKAGVHDAHERTEAWAAFQRSGGKL